MEWGLGEILTAVALCGSAIGWVVASTSRAITYRREQNQSEWERLHHLANVLYNKDYSHGSLAQIAAVYELQELRRRRSAAIEILREADEFWKSNTPGSAMIKRCEEAISQLAKPFYRRFF